MKNRKFSAVICDGKEVRLIYEEGLVTGICLNDICCILRRDEMIRNGAAMKICSTAFQLSEKVDKRVLWYVEPYDVTNLTRKVRREGKIAALYCDTVEEWLNKLPWGKTHTIKTDQDDETLDLDAVSLTKNTLELLFKEHPVSFKIISGRIYVSATQLSHIFNTLPSIWLRKIEVINMMDEMIAKREYPDLNAMVVTFKGKYGGTWIEERLGVEYAKFLSEELHQWYVSALQILNPTKWGTPKKNKKAAAPRKEEIPMPDNLEEAQAMIRKLLQERDECQHKLDFYDDYVENREWFKSMRLADELEISPYRLHQFLLEQGICTYEKRQWVVKPQHQVLQAEIPYLWTNPQGKTYAFGKVRRWTQTGRDFILDLYRSQNAL